MHVAPCNNKRSTGNMPGTRRRPRVEEAEPEISEQQEEEPAPQQHAQGAEASDDDDAPEEIGLTSGRALALEQSKAERHQRAAQEETRKTRRRAVQERNEEQKRAKQGRTREDGEQGDGGAEAAGPSTSGEDLLPDDVLEALQERRVTLAQQQAALVSQALQQQRDQERGKKRRKVLDTIVKGPVRVQVLRAAKRMAVASRTNFKKEQLLGAGARVRRSHDMLQPANAGRLGPSTKFT